MAKKQIKNYVFKPGIGALENLNPNAYFLINENKEFIQKEATAWIQAQVDAGTSGFVGYTYNQTKCERDVGYVIDAYLHDLRYGGNSETYRIVQYYWDGTVAQVDGDRQPEIQTHGFIRDLINTYILNNDASYTALSTTLQFVDETKTAEGTASGRITALSSIIINVITSGLSALPGYEATGKGYIKLQGKFDLEDILLITNTSSNEIIYNFGNNLTGGFVTYKRKGYDEDFVKFLQTTDTITTIHLNYNTSSMSANDDIQVFVEEKELTIRPYDFGTDAIERMRVAPPLAMLDADFEYGLQPTKWSAIGTLRGYPSIYELPGTEMDIFSITTDASDGTDGVGQSLITIVTQAPHNLGEGDPFTLKALEPSVSGSARAEGSFLALDIIDDITFTYYAKAKVGTSVGQSLLTGYTQLRKAGLYTGAAIGSPNFSIAAQGFSVLDPGFAGNLFVQLDVEAGETRIPFDGDSPGIGAPLINANLVEGTQVTGVIDTSAGGGEYITPVIVGNYLIGENTLNIEDTTGIVENLGADRGDGVATFVDTVTPTTLSFSDPFEVPIIGNKGTYANVSPTNIGSTGIGLNVNVENNVGVYTINTINSGGNNYRVGDNLFIPGTSLQGESPTNDLYLRVATLSGSTVTGLTIVSGTGFDGNAVINSSPNPDGGTGSGATFDITFTDNVFSSVTLNSIGSGYSVNDRLKVAGTVWNVNGIDFTNDLLFTVDSVDTGGEILTFTISGTAPDAVVVYNNPGYVTSGSGVNLTVDITRNGTGYSVSIVTPGQNFAPSDTVTIDGSVLGGASGTNDLVLTVSTINGLGGVTLFDIVGTAVNTQTVLNRSASNLIGSGVTFEVTISAGTYSITSITDDGANYGLGQTFAVSGVDLLGDSPTNDAIITVTGVGADNSPNRGAITSASISGTAISDYYLATSLVPSLVPGTGSGAVMDIDRDGVLGSYNITLTNGGVNYDVGNILSVPGATLDGTSEEAITITVDSVDGAGAIQTFTADYTSVAAGTQLPLIATVTLSEPTTGYLTTGDDISYEALATIQVDFPNRHGLVPGSSFIVTVDSDDGVNNHKLAAGSFIVSVIPDLNKINYQARAAGAIDTSTNNIIGTVYPKPDSFFTHRPFDGGVMLGTGGPQHGAQAIRQSKKYIRYQSGKGIMYTTGALFAPSYDLRSVTADGVEVGSTITIVTDDHDHGVQEGGIIRLIDIETPGYNSGPETRTPPEFDYEVINVVDERTFQVYAQRRLGSTDAVFGRNAQMSVVSWHGSTVRAGVFDDQNGIFWEYDGTQLNLVQRTGTYQLAGTIAVDADSNIVTGTNSRFRDQLSAGDRIIIRGMTHVVSSVTDQNELYITPDFRGVNDIAGAKAMVVFDKKVKQSEWNLDRLDGTGPSGYDMDPAKMQMIGIQYSWYGAGFIDYMARGQDGNFIFCHRMRNSNVNTEAFMRSGNLPVRYEVTNEGPPGKLAEPILDGTQNTMTLEDTSFFPDSGVVYIDNEIISFTSNNKSLNQLGNLTRGATFTNFQAGSRRIYSAGEATTHLARTGVILISSTITPLISHWGSAFLTDGGFDYDRGYIFSYAETDVQVTTTKQTAFLLRLAPSVSNAVIGDLGERDLLNRAQLLLDGIEITSDTGTGGIVVEGVLNPQNYPVNPNDVGWSGLATFAQGGQPSFAQIASGTSVEWSTGVVPTNSTATALATQTALLNSGIYNSGNNSEYIYINASDYRTTFGSTDLSPVIGKSISGGNTVTGAVVNSGYVDPTGNYAYFRLSQKTSGTVSANTTDAYELTLSTDLVNRNYAYLNVASFQSTQATIGTSVTSGGTVSFPPSTFINKVVLKEWAGTQYYEVQFNNPFTGTLANGTGTVEFTFDQPPYALPGETVFSFIAVPGERSTLSLDQLKEITNTPLGGRGTFPNGPDVLAINVYKVSGTTTPANIVLKWSEAQA